MDRTHGGFVHERRSKSEARTGRGGKESWAQFLVLMEKIFIVLATYNGADYLEPLLASLRQQAVEDWTLLVRDDGSQDGTCEILRRAAAEDGRIVVLHDNLGRRGPTGNFGILMQHAFNRGAAYLFLADQDDVWLADKIARTGQEISALERRLGTDRPLLVHSDLMVVDESLRHLGKSFWKYQNLDPRRGATLNRLLIWNVVTGCATMVNRPLLRKALPMPPDAVMHDWWLALVASLFGRIEYVAEPTLLYRQHSQNHVGAVRWNLLQLIRKAADRSSLVHGLRTSQQQARTILNRYGPSLPAEKRAVIEVYANLNDDGFLSRRWHLVRYGFYCTGWLRNLGLLARI